MVRNNSLSTTTENSETDEDPEYGKWIQEVLAASKLFLKKSECPVINEGKIPGANLPFFGDFLCGEVVLEGWRYRLFTYLRAPAEFILINAGFFLIIAFTLLIDLSAFGSTSFLSLIPNLLFAAWTFLGNTPWAWVEIVSICFCQVSALALLKSYRKPWRWINLKAIATTVAIVPIPLVGWILLGGPNGPIPLTPIIAHGFFSFATIAALRSGRGLLHLFLSQDMMLKQGVKAQATDSPDQVTQPTELILGTVQNNSVRIDIPSINSIEDMGNNFCRIKDLHNSYLVPAPLEVLDRLLSSELLLKVENGRLRPAHCRRLLPMEQAIETIDGRVFRTPPNSPWQKSGRPENVHTWLYSTAISIGTGFGQKVATVSRQTDLGTLSMLS